MNVAFIMRILNTTVNNKIKLNLKNKEENSNGDGLQKADFNSSNEITPDVKTFMLGWTRQNTFPIEETQ